MPYRFAVLATAVVLAACSAMPHDPRADVQPLPVAMPRAAPQPGAIYGGAFDLFADLRAREVGDILTIRLTERMNAENESTTSTSKDSQVDTGLPVIAGGPVTLNGDEIFNNEIAGQRSFAGQSDSSQSNRIDGTITVSVVERLANGNLVVSGDKWITINRGEELVRVTGIVRPVDIGPDNSVVSTKVANARIDYRGVGTLASSNSPGWLTRFFNSPWFPF
jgi:flagellar L-ring protein precursor FlgH